MAYGIFLTVLTAIIATFIGVGIADSEWLKKKSSLPIRTISYWSNNSTYHFLPAVPRNLKVYPLIIRNPDITAGCSILYELLLHVISIASMLLQARYLCRKKSFLILQLRHRE